MSFVKRLWKDYTPGGDPDESRVDAAALNDLEDRVDTGVSGSPIMDRVVGQWYGPEGFASSGRNWSTAAVNRTALVPAWLQAGDIDRLAVVVEGAGGDATWRIGLYPSDPVSLLPDGLEEIAVSADIDMSIAGRREQIVSATLPYSGIYWTAATVISLTDAPSTRRFDDAYEFGLVPSFAGAPTQMDPGVGGTPPLLTRRSSGGLDGGSCPGTIAFSGGPKIAVRAA